MRLPNYEKAFVPREKIVDYLLSFVHKDGRAKAEFFTRFGFASESWKVLADERKKQMIKELDQIVLKEDLPEYGLKSGDIGTVVLIHQNGKGYEVEFAALDGETLAVVSVFANQVRSIRQREIARVRVVESPLSA